MQNTTQKPSNNREHMKISRLKSGVITIALGVKKMKLAKVFVPAFAMMAIALGCIPAQSAESKIKIGVAMSNFDDVWLTYVRDAITKWASAHPDVQVTMVDGSDDTAKQVGQVENFLAQGMDAVVILPVDTSATGPVTKAVVKAGKPLVYVNRKPTNLPKGVVYCGSKSIEAGIMNMEELGKCMGGKGNVTANWISRPSNAR